MKKSQKSISRYFCLPLQLLTGIVTRQKHGAMQSIHLSLVYVNNEKKVLEGGGAIRRSNQVFT